MHVGKAWPERQSVAGLGADPACEIGLGCLSLVGWGTALAAVPPQGVIWDPRHVMCAHTDVPTMCLNLGRLLLCSSARFADKFLSMLHDECGLSEVTTHVRGEGATGQSRSKANGVQRRRSEAEEEEEEGGRWIMHLRPTFGYIVDGEYESPTTRNPPIQLRLRAFVQQGAC